MQHHGGMPLLFIAECYTVQPCIKAIPHTHTYIYIYIYIYIHGDMLFSLWNPRLLCNYNMEQTEKHNTIKKGIYGFQIKG